MSKKLRLTFMLVAIMVSVAACNDALDDSSVINDTATTAGITIEEAKAVFQQKITDYEILKSKVNVPQNPLLPVDYTPQWQNAVTSENEYIWSIEAPIINSGRTLATSHMKESKPWKAAVTQKVVVIKNKQTGETEMFVLTLIPDRKCAEKHKEHRERTYTHVGNTRNFSGTAVYTLWEGTNVLIKEHNNKGVSEKFRYDREKPFTPQSELSEFVIGGSGDLVLMYIPSPGYPGSDEAWMIDELIVNPKPPDDGGSYNWSCQWCGAPSWGSCTCGSGGGYQPPPHQPPEGGGGGSGAPEPPSSPPTPDEPKTESENDCTNSNSLQNTRNKFAVNNIFSLFNQATNVSIGDSIINTYQNFFDAVSDNNSIEHSVTFVQGFYGQLFTLPVHGTGGSVVPTYSEDMVAVLHNHPSGGPISYRDVFYLARLVANGYGPKLKFMIAYDDDTEDFYIAYVEDSIKVTTFYNTYDREYDRDTHSFVTNGKIWEHLNNIEKSFENLQWDEAHIYELTEILKKFDSGIKLITKTNDGKLTTYDTKKESNTEFLTPTKCKE